MITFMAIAVEPAKNLQEPENYRVWYLQLNSRKEVIGIAVKARKDLIHQLLHQYKQYGKSLWKAFLLGQSESTIIELFDFISMGQFQNTHFGVLPTIHEFQGTLDRLKSTRELNHSNIGNEKSF